MTDQAAWYPEIGAEFASHDTVNHAKDEYVRREGDKLVTTNTVEGFYSVFTRGMQGVYQLGCVNRGPNERGQNAQCAVRGRDP